MWGRGSWSEKEVGLVPLVAVVVLLVAVVVLHSMLPPDPQPSSSPMQ